MQARDAMRQGDELQPGNDNDPNSVRKKSRFRLVMVLGAALAVIVIAALSVPELDVHRRQVMNEVVTVTRLRRLNQLQNSYAASHPAKGFACQLPELKPATLAGDTYKPDELLFDTGSQSGYKFTLTACRTDSNGVVTQYQFTAVPLQPGITGFRVFCADHTGAMWYDSEGSAENCLAARKPLP
jgi:hypothetical protein